MANSLLFVFLNPEADSDTFSEPRSQKGLDHYLDSLFDPVLSYGNGVRKAPSPPQSPDTKWMLDSQAQCPVSQRTPNSQNDGREISSGVSGQKKVSLPSGKTDCSEPQILKKGKKNEAGGECTKF